MDAAILSDGTTGVVVNVIEVVDLDHWPGAIDLPAGMGIGWSYDGTTWSPPPPLVVEPHVSSQPTIETLLAQVQTIEATLATMQRQSTKSSGSTKQ